MKKIFFLLILPNVLLALLFLINSCNNPFSTREPENTGGEGVAIKPSKSPENVLYNLEASFEGLSIQDYLNVFSEDFTFHPDLADSSEYEEDFRNGWNYEKEEIFANNFLQRRNFNEDIEGSPIDIFANYEYKPGQDMYEYEYTMFIIEGDSTKKVSREIEGWAWLYFRENNEGKWSIYQWVDFRKGVNSVTWGVLRAKNI